jgi:hypothetical protein
VDSIENYIRELDLFFSLFCVFCFLWSVESCLLSSILHCIALQYLLPALFVPHASNSRIKGILCERRDASATHCNTCYRRCLCLILQIHESKAFCVREGRLPPPFSTQTRGSSPTDFNAIALPTTHADVNKNLGLYTDGKNYHPSSVWVCFLSALPNTRRREYISSFSFHAKTGRVLTSIGTRMTFGRT